MYHNDHVRDRELLPTIATVSFFVSIGYLVLRAYWRGNTDGLNSELFD